MILSFLNCTGQIITSGLERIYKRRTITKRITAAQVVKLTTKLKKQTFINQIKSYKNLTHQEIFSLTHKLVDSIVAPNIIEPSTTQTLEKPEKALNEKLSKLDSTNFGQFFLFDTFKSNNCTHGSKVFDVAKQVLHSYNLDFASKKIKVIPINYFSNQEKGDEIINEYILNNDDNDLDALPIVTSISDSLKKKFLNNDTHTPESYLASLFPKYLRLSPDVISSSFTVMSAYPFGAMSVPEDNTNTIWVTSATNEHKNIKDCLSPKNLFGTSRTLEPIASLMTNNTKGVIIVGCKMGEGTFSGMEGEGVTTMGKGNGWGVNDITNCIKQSDAGTSFATPEISTKLFIAKAYWRKTNTNIDIADIKRRVTLATDLNPSFVSKFASGGSLNLTKLIQTSSGYLVNAKGEVIEVDSIKDSLLFFTNLFGMQENPYEFDNTEKGLSGIYFENNKFFIYKNAGIGSWTEIGDVKKLNITVNCKGINGLQVIKLNDFKKNYKQFVYLKP